MMMNRREYKRKTNVVALEDEANISVDLKNWKKQWPSLIEKVESPRVELRIAALKAINTILTSKFIGDDLTQFIEDTFNSLHSPIFEYTSIDEHKEAMKVICNLSLNLGEDFVQYSNLYIDSVLSKIEEIKEEEISRIFTIAVLCLFSISSKQTLINTLNKVIIQIMKNKKFTKTMIAECIKDVRIIIISINSEGMTNELISSIIAMIDQCLTSQNPLILTETIEFIPVLFDIISSQTVEDNDEFSKSFVMKYSSKLSSNMGQSCKKKSDIKQIAEKAATVSDYLHGETFEKEIILSNQRKEFTGATNLTIIKVIKTITECNFQHQMIENPIIHAHLGYSLLAQKDALKLKKKVKQDIDDNYNKRKKERKMKLTSSRKKKDQIQNFESDDYFSFHISTQQIPVSE